MASNATNITIVGNLTRDPELRFANSGTAMVTFSVAVNKSRKNQQGEWEKETHYFDCVAYNSNAENLANSLTKGTRVIVSGSVSQRSWEEKDEAGNLTGKTRSKVEINVDEIAPTLRWATAVVTKNEYEGNESGANQFSGNKHGSKPSAPQGDYGFDTEPF